jgi:hypothetical protein
VEGQAGHGLRRLDLRIEKLKVTFRFTLAFHAREVRFECDRGDGFQRIFPETFSFHSPQNDPTELTLQLDDLFSKPQLLSPKAHPRDAVQLVTRLLSAIPRYLERTCDELEEEGRLDSTVRLRMYQDVAILAQILLRFEESRELDQRRSVRVASFLVTKLMYRSMLALAAGRVEPDYLARYVRGEVDPIVASDDPTESGFFHVLEGDDQERINRLVVRMTERAFYLWLEGVCLNRDNQAFEKEDSPFVDRETEILRAIATDGCERIERGADLSPFLRRPGRDCERVLGKLEAWFLRSYDIAHSSAIICHRAAMQRGQDDGEMTLTWHRPRNYVLTLGVLAAPFLGAVLAYERAPQFFDVLCSVEVLGINLVVIWFLVYQFCWKRDLTMFHASVPRIGAGIIVGYLPVFLIDEVWALAGRDVFMLATVVTFLGLATLLYIYVEIQRRLGGTRVAFSRARGIFLLGLVEASTLGVVMTSLIGRFMVSRNWATEMAGVPVETLRASLDPLVGQLPRVIGLEPLYAFPSAVLTMTFLSFFIGVFLQLMWEDLPITEPL